MPKRQMNIIEVLRWAFQKENAYQCLSLGEVSEARGYGRGQSGKIADMQGLGTAVQESGIDGSSYNVHSDAEALAHGLLSVTDLHMALWIGKRIETDQGRPTTEHVPAKATIYTEPGECYRTSSPTGWPPTTVKSASGRGRPRRVPSQSQLIEYAGSRREREVAQRAVKNWDNAMAKLKARVAPYLDTIELV